MKPVLRYVCIFALICICNAYQSPSEVILPLIDIPPEVITGIQPSPILTATGQISSGIRIMFELFNSKSCDFQGLLNNTKIRARTFPTLNSGPAAIRYTIALAEQGFSLIGGVATFQIASPSSQVGTVYDIATLSSFAPESQLSNKNMYPYFSRTAPSISDMVRAEIAAILNFSEQSGPGWTDIAIISELSEYGTDFCQTVIEQGHEAGLTVKQYRTFLSGTSYRNDLITIKNSGARLIIGDLFLEDFRKFLRTAEEEGLVGDSYVWFISPATTGTTFPAGSGSFPLARGVITAFLPYPKPDPFFLCYEKAWKEANTTIYPFAGTERLPLPALPAADFAMAIIAAYDAMDKMEMLDGRISAQMWADVIRNVSVTGINQVIEFLPSGDRLIGVSLFYYSDQTDSFVKFADTRIADGKGNLKLDFVGDVVWFSNTTDIPDLDIRPPFFYWSCKDGEKREDVTGKTISRQVPDGSDIDEIDIEYHCDYFIDCRNFSDESADCSSDYLALFIVFGIITGLLMFLTVALMIFVFIFGIILKYRRLKTASPFFLILLLFSILVGYSSIFAFFGKPHPVACAFQPWLLGLPTISMIAVLSVKNFRIYRIFRYPLKKTTITDWELLIWWTIVLIPAVIIIVLWMIISTPTADMETRSDNDHYVCTTGGFTGKPGGLVFFFIFVAYSALILLFGCVISVLSRNVPSLFNESKLLTISIYNLGFLAAVIIPVFLVVQPINPFLAWIFRTCAVLYAFTATMVLQFLPKVFGIVVLDKLTDKKVTSYVQTSTATLQ